MNKKMILKMAFDKNVIKSLLEIHKIFKNDKNYSIIKGIKAAKEIVKGEKIIKFNNKYIISTFMPPFPSKAFITHITAVKNKDNIFTQQMYSKRSAPISLYASLTNKCMYNCVHCSAKGRSETQELTINEWKSVFHDLQQMKTSVIGLTGGEPLLRNDLEELIESIDNRSSTILFTTGYGLTKEKALNLKLKGLFGIGISLDSDDKDYHNNFRKNTQAFDIAINAIKNASEAGLYTMVHTVVLKKNIDEKFLFKLFSFVKELGAHEVKLLEPIISGNLLTQKSLDEIFFDNESREKLITIQHKANKCGKFPKISSFAYTESKEKFGCGAGTQHSYISADGNLYPCDFVPMSFGNVKEKSIINLWSEMNDAIGNPKIGCFAMKVNKKIYNIANSNLPLCEEKSKELCEKHKSNEYPDYYKILQGIK